MGKITYDKNIIKGWLVLNLTYIESFICYSDYFSLVINLDSLIHTLALVRVFRQQQ